MGKKRKNKYGDSHEDLDQPAKKPRVSTSPLPEGVHHYQELEEVPWDLQKYWLHPDTKSCEVSKLTQ